jgi:tRNA threonylcarbamoyladenosine dehydratase
VTNGVERLYGLPQSEKLRQSAVMVIGIGGVGSWAVEALARSGVGQLILVDCDVVGASNMNRQIHTLESTLGANKVDVMALRIREINAHCKVDAIDEFLTLENCSVLLDKLRIASNSHTVIDAFDAPRIKAHLIGQCSKLKIPIVVSGAAGGRDDPLSLAVQDLAFSKGDPLLASVRSRLRREHGFSRDIKKSFGVSCITSTQRDHELIKPIESTKNSGAPLNCSGYGSIVTVTASMGFALASLAIKQLLKPS